ncbi:cytochrome P450 monooxygenase [Physcia stellaris]|nr:cytochrome P450 monooxygenase [Physcia stellaris]
MKSIFTSLGFIALASATCYQSGAPWPDDHAGMVNQIQLTAKHFANQGRLGKGEHVHNVNYKGKCLHFILDNISGSPRSITKHDAADGFLKEYTGCHNGGIAAILIGALSQQSSFQSLATPPASATGFWSEKKKTKPHKEVKTPKEAKEWVGGAKEERKDEEWKEWGIDLLFN